MNRFRAVSGLGVALVALLAFASDARAKCFSSGAELPMTATFADGSVATVLDRANETLSYRMSGPSGGTTEMRAKAGLFPLSSLANGVSTSFEWQKPLPGMSDLRVGFSFESATTLKSGAGEPRTMTSKVTVLDAETISLDGCDYPVLKVLQENRVGQTTPSLVTRYLHVPSMLTMRTIIGAPVRPGAAPKTIEHRITSLD